MTAGTVLFLIDALLAGVSWPLALHVFDYRLSPLDMAGFAFLDLLFLYALGFYRRDRLGDPGRANGRAPLAVALSVAAAMTVSALLGDAPPIKAALLALFCFSGSAL